MGFGISSRGIGGIRPPAIAQGDKERDAVQITLTARGNGGDGILLIGDLGIEHRDATDDQVTVGPIHRSLGGLAGVDLVPAFTRWFDLLHAGPATARVVNALAGGARP